MAAGSEPASAAAAMALVRGDGRIALGLWLAFPLPIGPAGGLVALPDRRARIEGDAVSGWPEVSRKGSRSGEFGGVGRKESRRESCV